MLRGGNAQVGDPTLHAASSRVMSVPPTIVLFDIDGTLVDSGGAARIAFERAADEVWGAADAFGFSFAGMTDRTIIIQALASVGLPMTDADTARFFERYLALLDSGLRTSPHHRLLSGAAEAVIATALLPDVATGIGTGNVEAGARLKLRSFGLNELLTFGGFGSDATGRAELIAVGAERGAQRLGVPLADCRLVIVGDTPADVAAAHANGGSCVGIASGRHSTLELQQAGAEHVFESLTAPGVLAAIGGDRVAVAGS